ncbi:MAG: cyclohexa-1,5-dienecarbonyl-CoA hydratase [Alphaproteobacteria bacterium]|nr:cyclohexa-1,5-dienecarbonyl-CoA hydratase [Alphaproteobacteria bacterium]
MTAPLKVWLEADGALLRLRLDRPKANVIDGPMVAALTTALASHAGLAGLKGVLLDAEGPNFSFGASVEEHLPAQCAAMLERFHALLLRMIDCPVPILVAVRGQCLGGGLELAIAGHLMFAAADAKFGQPEIKLGVFAPAASCLLPERVARVAAEDLLFSGRSVDAEEAVRIGLANRIADDPTAAAFQYYDEYLAPLSASSLGHAVRAARVGFTERVRDEIGRVERRYLDELMATRDAVEGLEAFIAKRAANWENR